MVPEYRKQGWYVGQCDKMRENVGQSMYEINSEIYS